MIFSEVDTPKFLAVYFFDFLSVTVINTPTSFYKVRSSPKKFIKLQTNQNPQDLVILLFLKLFLNLE